MFLDELLRHFTTVYLGGAVIGRSSPGFEINKINDAIIALLKDMNILGSLVDRSRNRDALHLKLEQELSTHSKEVWEVRKRLVGKDTYKKRYDCCPKKPKLLL